MRVLVASASSRRRTWYCEQLRREGFQIETTGSGVDCIERMRVLCPDVLLLEMGLMWGGSDGVLAVRAADAALRTIPLALVSVEGVTLEVLKLSSFSIESFFSRIPPGSELAHTLLALTGKQHIQQPVHT